MTDQQTTTYQIGDRVKIHTTTVRYQGHPLWVNYETGTIVAMWGTHTAVVQLDAVDVRPAINVTDLELL